MASDETPLDDIDFFILDDSPAASITNFSFIFLCLMATRIILF